jgi:hypoxanthine phosphoribosyltransferase
MVEQKLKTIITKEQIQKRIRAVARQISSDYAGKTVCVVAVLENSFMFMADLVRHIEVPVFCQFVKPRLSEKLENNVTTTEIFYGPEMEVAGRDVLLVEGIVQSGVTSEFLVRNFLTRGAASVKVATLLDRHTQRRVQLQPDYFGFLVDEPSVVGFGLAGPNGYYRNLPFVAEFED